MNIKEALEGMGADRLRELRDEAMEACGPWRDDVGRDAEREQTARRYDDGNRGPGPA